MPASENYTPNKHRMKGKGFVVFNKCPYCEVVHWTVEATPQPKHIRYWRQACQKCKVNRSKKEQGEGYELYGRTKNKAVNG